MNDSFAKAIQKSRTIKKLPKEMIVPKAERDPYYQHFTLKVKSLAEFIEIVNRLTKIIKRTTIADTLVYRGHSDYSSLYRLTPTIGRNIRGFEHSENQMFKEMITLRPEEFSGINSNFDLLSKMQHFGLPTRLLDFTYNPLIALYFACCSKKNIDSRVICTYDTSDESTAKLIELICGMYKSTDYNAISLDKLLGGVSQLRRYIGQTIEPLMAKPKYLNDRIKHQSAVFMVFPNEVYDLRSLMVVRGKKSGDEKNYCFFSLTEEEKHRLEFIRNEPEIYSGSFEVTSETLRKLFKYYSNQFSDFYNNEFGINPKYDFIFKDRFSIRNSIQEISDKMISDSFVSIVVESKYRKKMIEELEVIGINKSFVFPELEYTAEMIKNRYF